MDSSRGSQRKNKMVDYFAVETNDPTKAMESVKDCLKGNY
jgi:hypothetical protein